MDMSPMLQAREAPWARAAREDDDLLDAITHAVGGPFHLIYPDRFADNLGAFQAVLCAHGVTGRVYFGKKANKAGAWLSEVARLGGAVDVASVPELVHCLAHGIRGEDIGVTGAAKSDELLWLAARHGCTVAIDALDELERAVAIATGERPLAVLLRVLPAGSPHSRFGLNDGDLETALQRCATSRQAIEMRGFRFISTATRWSRAPNSPVSWWIVVWKPESEDFPPGPFPSAAALRALMSTKRTGARFWRGSTSGSSMPTGASNAFIRISKRRPAPPCWRPSCGTEAPGEASQPGSRNRTSASISNQAARFSMAPA